MINVLNLTHITKVRFGDLYERLHLYVMGKYLNIL